MLADKLGVSASTASESIRKLAEQGLVNHEKYGAVTLTESGRRAALAMVRRHRLLESFLVTELGYGWDEVHDEAEVLEHAVSDRLIARIDAKLGFPAARPARRSHSGFRRAGADPARPSAVVMQRRRRRHRGADFGPRSRNAALLRQHRHQPRLPAAGADPSRIRRNDLGRGGIGRRRPDHSRLGKPCGSSYLDEHSERVAHAAGGQLRGAPLQVGRPDDDDGLGPASLVAQ